jgi:hypothetical protein
MTTIACKPRTLQLVNSTMDPLAHPYALVEGDPSHWADVSERTLFARFTRRLSRSARKEAGSDGDEGRLCSQREAQPGGSALLSVSPHGKHLWPTKQRKGKTLTGDVDQRCRLPIFQETADENEVEGTVRSMARTSQS